MKPATMAILRMGFCVGTLITAYSTASAALTHPGFDPPLTTPDLLPFPSTTVDAWSAENGEIVSGLNDGIQPADGDQMIKFLDDGTTGQFNEIGQRVGVEHLASQIDAGMVEADFFACFNVPASAAGSVAGIYLSFFDGLGAEIGQSPVLITDPFDGDVETWEHATIGDVLFDDGVPEAMLPVGTRRVAAMIQFDNASLGGSAGYADKTHLVFSVVPEPSSLSLMLLGLGAASMARRRR